MAFGDHLDRRGLRWQTTPSGGPHCDLVASLLRTTVANGLAELSRHDQRIVTGADHFQCERAGLPVLIDPLGRGERDSSAARTRVHRVRRQRKPVAVQHHRRDERADRSRSDQDPRSTTHPSSIAPGTGGDTLSGAHIPSWVSGADAPDDVDLRSAGSSGGREFACGDALAAIAANSQALVFLDPPWGRDWKASGGALSPPPLLIAVLGVMARRRGTELWAKLPPAIDPFQLAEVGALLGCDPMFGVGA